MIQKPKFLATKYAEQFKDQSIVEAYRHRPPYPVEAFDILERLIQGEPRHVLDAGCGCGNIARELVKRVDRLDAVDFSEHMIAKGKGLPNGNNSRLRWLHGPVEEVPLDPPYGLVTAGESLHWMDWNVVLPRFREVLVSAGYLAVIEHDTQPRTWHQKLKTIITKFSTNKDFQEYRMLEELERHGLFQKIGEKTTTPIPFIQSVDDYIESYHSRNGLSRDRMDPAQAEAFDQEAKKILLKSHPEGTMQLQIVATIVWGRPQPR